MAVGNAVLDSKTIDLRRIPEGSVCVKVLAVAPRPPSENSDIKLDIGSIYAIPRKDLMKNTFVDGKLVMVNF